MGLPLTALRTAFRTARHCSVWIALLISLAPTQADRTVAQSTYHFGVQTSTGTDTLVAGVLSSLRFVIDSAGTEDASQFVWPIEFTFDGPNLIGPVQDTGVAPNVGFVPWNDGPDSTVFVSSDAVTNPDTALVRLVDTLPPHWAGTGEQWRVSFVPLDTGQITIDTVTIAPGYSMSAVSATGSPQPVAWQPMMITVAPYCPSGDLDGDGEVDGADLYILVRYALQSGPPPSVCLAHADVSCDGVISSADIILEIHYIYHGDKPIGYTCSPGMQALWGCQ